ncbi:hypothetical protein KGF57_004043 [Candida theae]|uniref:CAP-Gly domain-containing protein n=1 Tax=Candida theae TaxID=1198502 RepID=A0AAD5BBX1_9ASCO|nr:uncharacterized protein KGF57_004043 [Candida theae]KAI5953051.1 hypothetical protein KGF57_004043 [Candida theae]
MRQYKPHDRISTKDNHIATIKYVGHLPQWGSQVTAYGLEWDDASRGKNNGQINGVSYFTPAVAESASFIKSTNKNINHDRKSFVQVVREQYLDVDQYEAKGITFGGKVVEEVGWLELNEFHSQLRNLTSLSLDHSLIYCVVHDGDGDIDVKDVFGGLCNLTNLDLSSNLFSSMDDIWQIVSRLPKLEVLNINGNRFGSYGKAIDPDADRCFTHASLRVLKMASTLTPITQVSSIVSRFPHLRELVLSGNYYSNDDVNKLNLCETSAIDSLDLSYNAITEIPTNLPQTIHNLNVSYCLISAIGNNNRKDSGKGYNDGASSIESLDVRRNQISAWSDINNLSQSFPKLTYLKINHNPIFDDLSVDDMTCQLIGRFECCSCGNQDVPGNGKENGKLGILNGSDLTSAEIENGELYFISKVMSRQYDPPNAARWEKLLHKYGKSDDKRKEHSVVNFQPKRWINLMLKVRHIDDSATEEDEAGQESARVGVEPAITSHYTTLSSHRFLKTTSILKFKGLISRLFLSNISILEFNVYYYINEDTNFATRYEFDNWSSCLNDFVLGEEQSIYIDLHQK